MGVKFETLRARAKRLGWRLRRLNQRGPRALASKYAMRVGPDGEFTASDLRYIRALIEQAERNKAKQ
jgi:hypothetical protein